MKKLFLLSITLTLANLICATQAGPYTKHAYQPTNLPPLHYGLLTLHNTLSQPVDYALETYINAEDRERQIVISNGDKKAKANGTITAGATQALRTYPHAIRDDATQQLLPIFGGYVMLRLKLQAEQTAPEYQTRIEQPGSYSINLDGAGNLSLNQQGSEAELKANQ